MVYGYMNITYNYVHSRAKQNLQPQLSCFGPNHPLPQSSPAFCPNSMTGPRILPQSVSSQHSLAKRQRAEFSAAK
jgi:hypothetical protein